MYTLFIGALNKQERSNGISQKTVLEEVLAAGVVPDDLCRAVAVYDVTQGEKGIVMKTEKGWAVHFDDENSCLRAAWWLKPRLRVGTYNVRLNEEVPFSTFDIGVHSSEYPEEKQLEREVCYWEDLAARTYAQSGVSLNAVLFESDGDVKIVGCINPLYEADLAEWEDVVNHLAF